MNKLAIALKLSQIAWLALVVTIIAAGVSGSWKLAILSLLPLLCVFHGPFRGDIRGNQWAAFAVMPYFMYGVIEQTEQFMLPDASFTWSALVYWLASTVLFVGAMMHSRWQAQANEEAAENATH